MEKYKDYKRINNTWISSIPTTWKIEKLGWNGMFTSSGIDKKLVKGEPLVKMINFTDIFGNKEYILTNEREYMIVSCPESKKEKHQVNIGDLIFIPSSETVDEIGLSALVVEELKNTVYSYHVIRFQFITDFIINYKKYLCNNHFVLSQFSKGAKGTTRQIIGRNIFKNIKIIVPPQSEQIKIANFLDQKILHINSLTASKEKLINLLLEKRQALITHTVTRGLNLDIETKQSNIEWIGKIPSHWKVTRLKFIAKVKGWLAIGKKYKTKNTIKFPYLRVANVQDGRLALDVVKKVEIPHDEAMNYLLKNGDVLMNEGGDIDKLGRGCIWRNEIPNCLHQNHVFAVRPFNVSSEWLNIWTSTEVAKSYFESRAKRATNLASISSTNIKELFILLPPLKEQLEIVNYINQINVRIDEMISKTKQTIELLKERKESLISAAVTGQIKIPN